MAEHDSRTSRGARADSRAPVLEVFASFQGEGAFAGEPQTFVRLRGCPLRCAWCDTPGSWGLGANDTARIAAPGNTRREPSWATPVQAAHWISEVEAGPTHTVSATGGEPLLWPEFLLGLKPLLGGRRLHLETAAAHPRALERVLAVCDHLSLDMKLPADLGDPVPISFPNGTDLSRHEPSPLDALQWESVRKEVLRLARGRDACAKIVVAGGRRPSDYNALLGDLAQIAPDLPLYLQPATPVGGVRPPAVELLEALASQASKLGLAVRVVPQIHRVLGVP